MANAESNNTSGFDSCIKWMDANGYDTGFCATIEDCLVEIAEQARARQRRRSAEESMTAMGMSPDAAA